MQKDLQNNMQPSVANTKVRILFLIHDLGQGGAEKVLVNLANNMDRSKFDITVMVLFGGGVNERFLAPDIHFRTVFGKAIPGNSKLMKLLTPEQLHRLCVKEHYDIEIAYLEGPSVRIISGCQAKTTKLVSWVHSTMHNRSDFSIGFRNSKEAVNSYKKMNSVCFVSNEVMKAFAGLCAVEKPYVLYNTNDSETIIRQSREELIGSIFKSDEFAICGVGKVVSVKGFDRLARIHKRLRDEGYLVHCYILGNGEEQKKIQAYIDENGLVDSFTFLGYQTNPYKYVAKADLFVCCSLSEGFSTAATEALIVGTPVCTVEVSGMKEMLGEHNEWGVVTENSEEALYQGIKDLLNNPDKLAYYKEKAIERGKSFSTENTVRAVEDMLLFLARVE